MASSDFENKLDDLHQQISRCKKCRLCESRTNAVPGEGPAGAELMFIGEAPGKAEDMQGKPFVGRAGVFFDELLEEFGIRRDEIYITSAVKCRPPGNRNPYADELEICRANWLDRQIELVDPELVVLLGKVPFKQRFGREVRLKEIHGERLEFGRREFFVTFHPAAGMRFGEIRKMMRQDFEKFNTS